MPAVDSPQHLNPTAARLDGPPPAPAPLPAPGSAPGGNPSGNLMNLVGGPGMAGSPQQMAVTGLALMEQGSRLISAVLPGLSPVVAEAVSGLREAVPRALSELTTGGSSLPAGANAMMPYQPGMPGVGGPGAGGPAGANTGMRPPGPM